MPLRVLAIFQFYVPFVLPRTTDWPGKQLDLQFIAERARATVIPAQPGEALFIDEAGIRLRDERIQRDLPPPSPRLDRRIGDSTLDRVQVQVRKEVAGIDELRRDPVLSEFFRVAIRACNAFLTHARVIAVSPDPMQVEVNDTGDGILILTPQTNTWWNEDDDMPLPVYGTGADGTLAAAGSAYSRRVTRGNADFAAIAGAVQQRGEFADLVATLLLDAEAYVTAFRVSEALLAMGAACEVASKAYVERRRISTDHAVREALRGRRRSFAERRFHDVTQLIDGRSLAHEDRATFRTLEQMYRARNNVAHAGYPFEHTSRGPKAVTPARARELLVATRQAIRWLNALHEGRRRATSRLARWRARLRLGRRRLYGLALAALLLVAFLYFTAIGAAVSLKCASYPAIERQYHAYCE